MKRCPECRRDYYDDSLLYCLDDGTALLEGPASAPGRDEPETALLHETDAPGEAATKAQIHTTNYPGPGVENVPSSRQFPVKWVAVAGVFVLLLGGAFFGYRYFNASAQINSIAVMPFVNESGNGDLEYLSDGITESLINGLSQLPKLSVKARSSVFRYKGKDIEPQQVASDLKVQAVLNGRVIQRGDNLSISLDLVDGSSGNQIWGEKYTRKIGDLAALQMEIARDVSQKLRARLTGAEESRVTKGQTQDSEAYQLYLQGRYNWNKRTDATTSKGIEFFNQAIARDPNYALAYVGLAESYILNDVKADEKYSKATAAALKAVELDPTLGEPHATLGGVKDLYEHDPGGAEQEYKRAIELSPNYATAHHWYAEFLSERGRFDEAQPVWNKALELEPFSLAIGTDYALEYLYYSRKYDQAVEYLKKLVDLDPNYMRTHTYLAEVYEGMGRFDDAISERERRAQIEGVDAADIARIKGQILQALRSGGARGYWSKTIEVVLAANKGKEPPAVSLASMYSYLGESGEAVKWLEKAYERKDGNLIWLNVDPKWDNIRNDSRFKDLTKRMNLPQ